MKKSIYLFPLLTGLILVFSCQRNSSDLEAEIRTIENGLMEAVIIKGEEPVRHSLEERMKLYNVPGVSLAVIRDGRIRWARGYGMANTEDSTRVGTETLFQAGSVSKPVAALAVLKLADEGKVDLDTDVNLYLKEWKIPETRYTKVEKVTLRRLLTHTAGMTVHGFPGYSQKDSFPTIEQVLNGEGNTGPVVVDTIPGSLWRYSGGGYTVMERVVEEVTGLPLEVYMEQEILEPLGMRNSSYRQPLPAEMHHTASAAYDPEGELIEGLWHNYPEQAAAGLWTTPSDLALYCLKVQEIIKGRENGILSREMTGKMLTPHKNSWGLGPHLYGEGDSMVFGHGGKNAGYTCDLKAFVHRGEGVVIMTGADNGGALINELMRSLSDYYGWDFAVPREVEPASLTPQQLEELAGTYRLGEKIPGTGEYMVEVEAGENSLIVFDPNTGQHDTLVPLSPDHFIGPGMGNQAHFRTDTVPHGMRWNERFQFYRTE